MALINFLKEKFVKDIKIHFIPETIGSITCLQKNLKNLKKTLLLDTSNMYWR